MEYTVNNFSCFFNHLYMINSNIFISKLFYKVIESLFSIKKKVKWWKLGMTCLFSITCIWLTPIFSYLNCFVTTLLCLFALYYIFTSFVKGRMTRSNLLSSGVWTLWISLEFLYIEKNSMNSKNLGGGGLSITWYMWTSCNMEIDSMKCN